MSEAGPSCVVTVAYTENRFSYSLGSGSTSGWTVSTDGVIIAPQQAANFQEVTVTFQSSDPSSYIIAGLWILDTPPVPWIPLEGVTVNLPEGVEVNPGEPTITFKTRRSSPYCYQLALSTDGGQTLVWDDPKIYDDGSQVHHCPRRPNRSLTLSEAA